MNVLIIIPVRMGSKRLPNKNILPINGVPMFLRVAYEAKKSRYNPFVTVSSESKKIKEKCIEKNIFFHQTTKKIIL